jgi:hypothetical protein
MAPSHPIVRQAKTVSFVDYNVTKQSRLQNKVVGKGKKGGIWLEPMSPLCDVSCTDGSKYRFYACIRGHLLEVNENLIAKPEVFRFKAASDGYLAIINPKHMDLPSITEKLLAPDAYRQLRNVPLLRSSLTQPAHSFEGQRRGSADQ